MLYPWAGEDCRDNEWSASVATEPLIRLTPRSGFGPRDIKKHS